MKHYFFPLLFVICCSNKVYLQSSSIDQRVQYYSTMVFVETPISYLKGSIPMVDSIAKSRNHYRFSYNNHNQLQSIAFYNGEFPREPNHTANLFTLAHKMVFEYSKNQEIISFYNSSGLATGVLGNVYRFVYQLNEFGFRVSLIFEDQHGNQIENAWGIYDYQWEYLRDGSVIEERFDQNGKPKSIRPGFEFYRLHLFFNPSGQIALMQNINQDGTLLENTSGASQDQIITNAAGNFLQWRVLNNRDQLEKGNGPNVAVGKQKFDEYGYEIELEHRDENNNRIYSAYGICNSRTSFDKFGNLSERRFYSESGEASVHQIAGYHHLKISWDHSGNYRTRLQYFNLQGEATLHRIRGYHAVQYSYTNNGRLKKVRYLDTEGNLCNRKDNGIAYIAYHYDQQSGKTTRTNFDKNHQKL